jgi:hypothetical protein
MWKAIMGAISRMNDAAAWQLVPPHPATS